MSQFVCSNCKKPLAVPVHERNIPLLEGKQPNPAVRTVAIECPGCGKRNVFEVPK